ncbi:hypothetical membrane protein [Pelotomaculum thermopropionicum SI]|uniref:Hypothetical membrane protein n=1 Tax=Pelotomaculum thermopropionicum (strain DSM 13744 / JCM 10971 / SI) TaxID=370438 RepID=A5D5Y7_PELTS|nr:hypothetical membrane protein [Pelotomaculum thermopropionicum SI]
MKKIIAALLVLAFGALSPFSAYAGEVQGDYDYIVKVLFDDSGPKGETYFLPLRATCEKYGYKVEWDGINQMAVVTKGTAEKLTDGNGNNIEAVIFRPGASVVEMVDESKAKIDEVPAGREAILSERNGRMYINEMFLKYFGLKAVVK